MKIQIHIQLFHIQLLHIPPFISLIIQSLFTFQLHFVLNGCIENLHLGNLILYGLANVT